MSEDADFQGVVRLTPEEAARLQERVAEVDGRFAELDDDTFSARLEARLKAARERIALNRYGIRRAVSV